MAILRFRSLSRYWSGKGRPNYPGRTCLMSRRKGATRPAEIIARRGNEVFGPPHILHFSARSPGSGSCTRRPPCIPLVLNSPCSGEDLFMNSDRILHVLVFWLVYLSYRIILEPGTRHSSPNPPLVGWSGWRPASPAAGIHHSY